MNYKLRLSTDENLNEIEQWLNEQECETFLCNFDLTKEKHFNEELLVYCEEDTDIVIAYLWLDFGILEVKKSHQNQGIGKSFVTDALEYIKNKKLFHYLKIECTPETSIPFWKKIGFNFYYDNYAYFIIEKQLNLPSEGDIVEIIVKQYVEAKDYNKSLKPLIINKQKAIKLNNKIYLSERIIICQIHKIWNGDAFIEILVNGNLIYKDKAKRPDGRLMGIKDEQNSFIIDNIIIRQNVLD
jgi:GNAT superfamily N-acetyltransferase